MESQETTRPSVHAVEAYQAPRERVGVALCLSGGGYRAALFHLGAARRLFELGVLSQVDTIVSVSGGSILAARLAQALADPSGPGMDIGKTFRAFTRRNIRTPALLSKAWPWNWFRKSVPIRSLAGIYEKHLTAMRLRDLPDRPRFIMCATDLNHGVNWVFEKHRMGDYRAGYTPPGDWPVAKAVAASSCFPPVFNPLPVGDLRLTDGGNYDNLGLEPVWKSHRVVLVSDGGSTFEFHRDQGLFWRLNRYAGILGNQVVALRKRWLISNFLSGELEGTYWGVGSVAANYGATTGYSEAVVEDVIRKVRTDLDAFSDAEANVLENHGYFMADAAIQRHAPALIKTPVPAEAPYPTWMEESRVRIALADSHCRRLLGRW